MVKFISPGPSATLKDAPIIAGLSARVAGPPGNAGMWHSLRSGICTVGRVNPRIFNVEAYFDPKQTRIGRTYSIASGQLDNVYNFDPAFFGISPRAAEQMDPQQRLVLRAVWEAVEDSGLAMSDLAGDRTGVFMGASIVENLSLYYYDGPRVGSQMALGNTLCIIANRVSSIFDFRGPSYAVDTACASGLYALHQAAEAIRHGEIDTAIVGTVAVLRTPGGFIGFSQARMMSPTGLCQAFDAKADGYVRSEACVALVLQREDVARKMGTRQRARLLASAVNTDGATSEITIPSGSQQQKLMDRVLAESGLDPDELDFYEAHGTGTAVGDPIEAGSIGASLGVLRRNPLLIGSSKTNFGHSEPAAGLVALSKCLLSFEHRALPASLHFTTPNPAIDFEGLNLSVNTELRPLSETGVLRAGLNAFGFGGTNVSAMIESVEPEWTKPKRRRSEEKGAEAEATSPETPWLMLSAVGRVALRKLAAAWSERLKNADPDEQQMLAAAQGSLDALQDRLAVPLNADAPERLLAFSQEAGESGLVLDRARLGKARTVFAFPGNGVQILGMGQREYEVSAQFRSTFDEITAAFDAQGGPDLHALRDDPDLTEKLAEPMVAQSLLFAYQIALARNLMALGIQPDAVVGHSVGEIAALHLSGAYSLDDAVHIIRSRSLAFAGLRGTGGMAAVSASEEDLAPLLTGLDQPDLVIAAVNAPKSVTVSGKLESLERLARTGLNGQRLPMVRLKVEIPYHSPAVDQLRERFEQDIAPVRFHPPKIPVAGSAVGRILQARECDASYLWRNARDPVRFADAVMALAKDGPVALVEIGPSSSLLGNVRDLARFKGASIVHYAPRLPAEADLLPGADPQGQMQAQLWAGGLEIARERLTGPVQRPLPVLPAYPFDEQEYQSGLSVDALDAWGEASPRLLAGVRAERSSGLWMAEYTPTAPLWVQDHKVGGSILLPAAAMAEIALSAAYELWGNSVIELENLDIVGAVVIEDPGTRLRTTLDLETGELQLSQRPRLSETDWSVVARGQLRTRPGAAPPSAARPSGQPQDITGIYDTLAGAGLNYGPAFRRLDSVQRPRPGTLWAKLAPKAIERTQVLDFSGLDASFHAMAVIVAEALRGMSDGRTLVPVRIGKLTLWQIGVEVAQAKLEIGIRRQHSLTADVLLYDASGQPIATLDGVEFSAMRIGLDTAQAPSRAVARKLRLRLPQENVALPPGWDRIGRKLATLGFAYAKPSGAEVASGGAQSDLVTKLSNLRRALALAPASGRDDLSDILNTQPDLAPDLRALLVQAAGEGPSPAAQGSRAEREKWQALLEICQKLAATWRAEQRMNLLIVGLPDPGILRQLVSLPNIDRVALARARNEDFPQLPHMVPQDLSALVLRPKGSGGFDVMADLSPLGTDPDLTKALAPGGLWLRLDHAGLSPDLSPPSDLLPGVKGTRASGILPLRLSLARRAAVAASPAAHAQGAKSKSAKKLAPTSAPAAVVEPAAETAAPPPFRPVQMAGPLGVFSDPSRLGLPALPEGDGASHRLLLHFHSGQGDFSAEVTALLMQFRVLSTGPKQPALLICRNGDADSRLFGPLVEALSAGARSLANERPDLEFGLIVLEADAPEANLDQLQAWCDAALKHQRITVSAEGVTTLGYVPERLPPKSVPQVLAQQARGDFNSLIWQDAPARRLRPEEIEIDVEATGVNFRDVMLARGLLPERLLDLGISGTGLGMECAGIVRRIGSDVTDLVPGQRVMALAASAFANRAIMPANAVCPLPEGLSFASGASIPVAFLTAWYALHRVARLRQGESVLIHGGAGGVGLAAIQIARDIGAKVYATAGSADKRAVAQAFGAEAVFNSRDLSFADDIKQSTDGRGVDVVLNSLAGEAMRRSVGCLAPFGRFIELGKRDFLEGTPLELRSFLHNLSYHGVDLDQVVATWPDEARRSMAEIAGAFTEGRLRPLPTISYAAEDVSQAFSAMLTAQHTGKIVVTPPVLASRPAAPRRLSGHWLILGGTGGLGLETAKRLLDEGASHVHLASRAGEVSMIEAPRHAWVQSEPRVSLHAADAAEPEQLAALIDQISAAGRLEGVIHAAMVLRDRMIADLDQTELEMVLRGKLGVSLALDQVLRERAEQPDHVIFFSSIVAKIGNVGQIAYGAANAATEAIAARRRADGLPGLAIGWGPIGDAGYLARDQVTATRLSRQSGISMIRVQQLNDELIRAIRTGATTDYSYASLDWNTLADTLACLDRAPFSALVSSERVRRQPKGEFIAKLRAASPAAALQMLRSEITLILARVLRLSPDQIDPDKPLTSHGIDSLMAMELRLEVEQRFGSELPVTALSREITAARLAAELLTRLHGPASDQAAD